MEIKEVKTLTMAATGKNEITIGCLTMPRACVESYHRVQEMFRSQLAFSRLMVHWYLGPTRLKTATGH